jgi:cobalt/nickel transport system ATP-binding protein
MSQYILAAEKIAFTYMDGTRAINNLSISIPRGKKVAVIGNNGAGKTTLFLHFNGINRPGEGKVKFNGENLDYSSKGIKELRKKIGLVFQDPDNQLFSASVYQDISFGPVNLGWPEETIRLKIEQVMRQTGVWDLREKPTHFLSYGQKKRVAIAGVLVMEPEVVVLDEPTAGLDPVYTSQMMNLLDKLNQNGVTVVMSSHNLDEVYAWADYIFVLSKGTIIAEGLPVDVFRCGVTLKEANLKKPWVLELYDTLINSRKFVDQEKIPVTREELIRLISR